MLSPLPRPSGWAYYFAHSPSRVSLPRKGHRVGLRIVLFEACLAFTRVTACTLALSPIRDTHSEGFSYFVTSIAAPAASGWSPRLRRSSPVVHQTENHRVFGAVADSASAQLRFTGALTDILCHNGSISGESGVGKWHCLYGSTI